MSPFRKRAQRCAGRACATGGWKSDIQIALTLALLGAILALLRSRSAGSSEHRSAEPDMRKASTADSSFEAGRV